MPRSVVPQVPKYRLHKASGQAIVTIQQRDHYLGPWKSKASRLEYDRLIGEWLAAGRPSFPAESRADITIAELIALYWPFAKSHYVKNGEPTGAIHGIRAALGILRRTYGHVPVVQFGPLALKAVQAKMVELGQSRRYVNDNVDRIRRMFKWAVGDELIPPALFQALAAVPGLRKGKTAAKDYPPVRPVSDAVVDTTLPHLPPVVADMVRFQRLTGARPKEVCILRPTDVDTAGEIWNYQPSTHKTEHHDLKRVIFIGPKAQDVLRKYLAREATAYCFSPAESEQNRNAKKRAGRKTRITPSQSKRRRKRKPLRQAGSYYTKDSYRRAIVRACALAFPAPENLSEQEVVQWNKEHRWAPNRLRHAAATEIRRHFGLEAAQVTLGHSSADVTQLYAERDWTLAARIMGQVG